MHAGIIIDRVGTRWAKTPLINGKNGQPFYKAMACYCDMVYDGAGYTFSDEYGDCTFCTDELVEWEDIQRYGDWTNPRKEKKDEHDG